MAGYSVIGKSLPRLGVRELVTGQAKFSIDQKLPGMLWGKVLRSPHPHARILAIDTTQTERLPGVKAVITARDVPGDPRTAFSPQVPPLAKDRVRYVGEPVAGVAAIDESVATEALDSISVEYEELPAVFDMEEAMQSGAPQIHDAERNVAIRFEIERGDVEENV